MSKGKNLNIKSSSPSKSNFNLWMSLVHITLLLLNLLFLCIFLYFLAVNSGLYDLIMNYIDPYRGRMSKKLNEIKINSDSFNSPVTVIADKVKYHGLINNDFNKTISVFLGIPFALPPIGRLRFRKPISPIFKSNIDVDATKYKPKCLQIHKDVPIFTDLTPGQSEDCLYLNIWTPFSPSSDGKLNVTGSLKPVMIWIHGGGFFKGAAGMDETDGRVLTSFGDVVVVSIEYRLGPFGFIDLDSDLESGNQGLHDQVAGFKFVKENIKYFGGDPKSITLFGESSGAISISLHMISPESSKYFSRAILQSGSAFMTDSFFYRSQESVPEFVKLLGCVSKTNTTNDADLSSSNEDDEGSLLEPSIEYDIECLKESNVKDILNATNILHKKFFFPFHPIAQEELIPLRPSQVAKSSKEERNETFANIKQVLMGTNSKSFSYMLYLANNEIFSRFNVNQKYNSIDKVGKLMRGEIGHLLQMPRFQVDFLTDKLFKNIRNETDESVWLDKLIEVLGDMSFICPMNELADQLTSLSKDVYLYIYSHQSPNSPWGSWFGPTLHDEVPLVFGTPLRYPLKYSGKDIDMSKRLMKIWTNFAKTGNVLPQFDVEWPKYTDKNKIYMILNSNSSQIKSNLSQTTCESFKLAFDLLS